MIKNTGIIVFLLITLFTNISYAETFKEEGFNGYSGVIAPTKEEYLKIEQAKMVRSYSQPDAKSFSNLPPSADLAASLPKVANQGNQNSCVGWVISFAMKSFQENRELGWGFSEKHLFSPAFIYNQMNDGVDEGSDLLMSLEFMRKNGTAPMPLMPYDENDFKRSPSSEAKEVAAGFKILGYRRVNEQSVDQMRSYLASGEPVAIIMEVYSNFLKSGMAKTGGVYTATSGKFLGYHAITVVGYDDTKKAIKVMNSWGKEWGERGYGWISYDLFPTIVKQAYVMYDMPTESKTVAMVDGAPLQQMASNPPHKTQDTTPPATTTATNTQNTVDIKPGSVTSGTPPPPIKAINKIILVPDEAGVVTDDRWLRLSSPSDEAKKYLQDIKIEFNEVRTSDDVLGTKTITKLEFYPTQYHEIATNQGITFGMNRADVERIYRKADYVDPKTKDETYFFQSATDDWGGVPVTRIMSLNFHYSPEGKVSYMSLEKVFKDVKTNTSMTPVSSGEGGAPFFPSNFNDVQKSDWG